MCTTGYERNDNLCKARIVSKAASIEQGNEINKQLSSAMSQIQSLSTRIEASKDMKESQDLANALQAQSLKMQAIKCSMMSGIIKIKQIMRCWSHKNKRPLLNSRKKLNH